MFLYGVQLFPDSVVQAVLCANMVATFVGVWKRGQKWINRIHQNVILLHAWQKVFNDIKSHGFISFEIYSKVNKEILEKFKLIEGWNLRLSRDNHQPLLVMVIDRTDIFSVFGGICSIRAVKWQDYKLHP